MDNQIQELTRQLKSLLERSGKKIILIPQPPEEFLKELDEETFSSLVISILNEHNRRIRVYNSEALTLGPQRGDDQIQKRTVPKRYY